jgi:hypothetical protein
MARFLICVLVILATFGLGASAIAQSDATAAHPAPSPGTTPKAHAKKIVRKKTAQKKTAQKKITHQKASITGLNGLSASEEAEKAARLAEGRKKFFEQSSGFDEGNSNSPLSGGGNKGGFTPGIGFKF